MSEVSCFLWLGLGDSGGWALVSKTSLISCCLALGLGDLEGTSVELALTSTDVCSPVVGFGFPGLGDFGGMFIIPATAESSEEL